MMKLSFGWRVREMIEGSALSIGLVNGSESLNLGLILSVLYFACFRYTSPIDLDTCTTHYHISTGCTSFHE